jgi:acyl CoA:acetate/3-ketoacid CoA transferase alpha subunit/acyl CoA:acetate/3-ketoacid CoA transferase beta subunit
VGVLASLRQAVAGIPEGALITLGGFQLNRAPMALVSEIVRQGRAGLRVVTLPNPLAIDVLVGAGAVEEAEFGFNGFQYEEGFAVAPSLKRAIQSGALRWRERDVYEIVQGLRAAAMGLPFLPAPGGEGSDYRKVNRTVYMKTATMDEEVPIVEPIRPDVALIHAQEADRDANLTITDLYAEDLLARASRQVIATAERIVDRISSPTIPGTRVACVTEAPGGASPTACHRHYRHSPGPIRSYVGLCSDGRFAEARRALAAGGAEADAPRPGPAARAPRPAGTRSAETPAGPTEVERLVVSMARCLNDGDVVTTGVASALPMLSVALARATRAPGLTYINCVGAVNPRIDRMSVTSVDAGLLDGSASTVTLPELFDLARQNRIDAMFFGGAQVDMEGRINLTCIGDYARPRVKLAGPAGAPSMRSHVSKVILVVPRHTERTLVPRVDFATAVASRRNRETMLVSDLALMRLEGGRLRLVSRHAGVAVETLRSRTGFDLEGDLGAVTPEPTAEEMEALRRLDPDGLRYRMI